MKVVREVEDFDRFVAGGGGESAVLEKEERGHC